MQAIFLYVQIVVLCCVLLNECGRAVTAVSSTWPVYGYNFTKSGQQKYFTGRTDLSAINFNMSERNNSLGELPNFKIASWSLNGIRRISQREFVPYLLQENPDIFCVQKLHCIEQKLPPIMFLPAYYTYIFVNTSCCVGVGLYTKIQPLKVVNGLGISKYDAFANLLTAEYEKFYLVVYGPIPLLNKSGYFAGQTDWFEDLLLHIKRLDQIKPVILAGCLLGVNTELDFSPKMSVNSAGLLNRDRRVVKSFLESGFVDTFRRFYPNAENVYSFWIQRRNGRENNIGRRSDYFLVSSRFLNHCCDSIVRTDIYGSQHCPIVLYLHI